ncbi:MAG: divalent metal cation transporter [Armatimonadetes bacterium]|nr:divalent metal cation transporter [Armatimonadota bacterium]
MVTCLDSRQGLAILSRMAPDMVGLIGTTITPYMQLFQQRSIVEKGVARRHYGPERVDAYAGTVFSNLMSVFMIIATAATLHVAEKTDIEPAADAARALQPAAGHAASIIFAVSLLEAAILAAAVLPLATAYSVSEVFGLPKGVNQDPRCARFFFRLFTALVILGAALVLIPGIPIIPLLLGTRVLNGIMLPVMLVFILLLINDHRLVGDLRNSRRFNAVAWTTFAMVTLAVVELLGSQLLSLFGIHPFGKG